MNNVTTAEDRHGRDDVGGSGCNVAGVDATPDHTTLFEVHPSPPLVILPLGRTLHPENWRGRPTTKAVTAFPPYFRPHLRICRVLAEFRPQTGLRTWREMTHSRRFRLDHSTGCSGWEMARLDILGQLRAGLRAASASSAASSAPFHHTARYCQASALLLAVVGVSDLYFCRARQYWRRAAARQVTESRHRFARRALSRGWMTRGAEVFVILRWEATASLGPVPTKPQRRISNRPRRAVAC